MPTDDRIPTESDPAEEMAKYEALTEKVREKAGEINARIKALTDEYDIRPPALPQDP